MNREPIDHLFIITGTTRGLGKALCEAAGNQPRTFVVSLSRAASSREGNIQTISIDLTDTDAIGPLFSQIRIDPEQTGPRLQTVLINNAGVLDPIGPIGDCDDGELAAAIRVNLIAPMVLTRHFFRFARRLPGCKWIVNITSGAARTPYPGWAAYGASKAGLDMATAVTALDVARVDPNFAAIAVAPGTIDTAMQTTIRQCDQDRFPMVDKFIRLKAEGGLDPPREVADRLIRSLLEDRFKNGGRYDLRDNP